MAVLVLADTDRGRLTPATAPSSEVITCVLELTASAIWRVSTTEKLFCWLEPRLRRSRMSDSTSATMAALG